MTCMIYGVYAQYKDVQNITYVNMKCYQNATKYYQNTTKHLQLVVG